MLSTIITLPLYLTFQVLNQLVAGLSMLLGGVINGLLTLVMERCSIRIIKQININTNGSLAGCFLLGNLGVEWVNSTKK